MVGGRHRRVLAEHAARAGFGQVVRVHRQRSDGGVAAGGFGLSLVIAVPAAVAVIYWLVNDSTRWRWVVLGYAALVGLTAAWVRWAPVKNPRGRHWFAVAEGGLLVWAPNASAPPSAIPWSALRVERRTVPTPSVPFVAYRLAWSDGGQERGLDVPDVSGRNALLRAVERRAPVGSGAARRLAGQASIALATALVLWFVAVPVALDVVFGERAPHDIGDFARMCEGGDAFGRAAPYQGGGPHPMVVFLEGYSFPDYYQGLGESTGWPPGRHVQLVGCARLIGRASPTELRSCTYSGGHSVALYQGRYRIDIYSGRTGKPAGTFTVDGSSDPDCSEYIRVPDEGVVRSSKETKPVPEDYPTYLSPLVNGDAGG